MVDQVIDKRQVNLPGPVGDITPQAREALKATKSYRDEAQTFAANTVALQDAAVSTLIMDETSKTRSMLADALASDTISMPGFMRCAHRGGTGYPEQSINGCRYSWDHGYVPEVDVWLLSDGTPVLCHDRTTGRTMTGADTDITTMSLEDWRSRRLLPVISGGVLESPPLLTDFMRACNGRVSQIEIKQGDQRTLDIVSGMILKAGYRRNVYVTCASESICRKAAALGLQVISLQSVIPSDAACASLLAAGITRIAVSLNLTSGAIVSHLHDQGILVYSFETSGDSTFAVEQAKGVDGVTSNMIDYVTHDTHPTGEVLHDSVTDWFLSPSINYGRRGIPKSVSLTGGTLTVHADSAMTIKYSIMPIHYIDMRINTLSDTQTIEQTIEGTCPINTGTDADPIFLQFGVFSPSTGNYDEGFVEGETELGQESIDIIIRKSGNILVRAKTNGKYYQTAAYKINGWPSMDATSRYTFDLNARFTTTSVTITGIIAGIRLNNVNIAFGAGLKTTRGYAPFIAFKNNSEMGVITRWNVGQKTDAYVPRGN
jgi:glycerophosphoryl diester phosphodiesterase